MILIHVPVGRGQGTACRFHPESERRPLECEAAAGSPQIDIDQNRDSARPD